MSKIAKVWIMTDYAKGLTQFKTLEHGESKRFFCTEWDLPNGSWILLETSMVWEHQPPITTPRKLWNHFCPGTTLCLLGSWWSAALKEWQLDKTCYKTYKKHKIFSPAMVIHCAILCIVPFMIPGLSDYRLLGSLAVEARQHLDPNVACPVDAWECEPLLDLPGLAVNRSKMSIDDNHRRG